MFKKNFFAVLIIILAIFIAMMVWVKKTSGQVGGGVMPFGGMVMTSIYCTCSGNFLLTIGPPMGGQFVFNLGTPQYMNYRLPSSGVWALGLYTPVGVCTMYAGVGCTAFGAPIGTISATVGTSL